MGFLEYARSLLFEKDELKVKLLLSPEVSFPQFSWGKDGFVNIFPEPMVKENEDGEKTVCLMGYCFPDDCRGKRQLANLFRASVFHLSAHNVCAGFEDYEKWRKDKEERLAKFAVSLVEDVVANAYVSERHPDKLLDLAFANALALRRLRPIDKLLNPATRVMANLLMRVHTGVIKVKAKRVYELTTHLEKLLDQLREKVLLSFAGEEVNLMDEKLKIADEIYSDVEDSGPLVEVPFLPHTEELGRCSIFSPSYFVDWEIIFEEDFRNCLGFLGGSFSSFEGGEGTWRKVAEAEGLQAFDSWGHQKRRNEKIIGRYEELLGSSRFRGVGVPQQCYSKFLGIRSACKSEAYRLIESLLVARDALDEDPRKMYGVLDLQEAIQVVASKSPRMDVFMLDENISKSYAWAILLDASRSMGVMRDFALEVFAMLGEAANQLLLDPASWSMYAFNDRFWVVKDPREQYNMRVKSRIGGLRFEGLTFLPDALRVAGDIIKERNENLRLITVISDGWPYGYSDVEDELSETVEALGNQDIAVMGIGAKSRRMKLYFKKYCTVYTLRDLKKRFSNLYMEASRIAVET